MARRKNDAVNEAEGQMAEAIAEVAEEALTLEDRLVKLEDMFRGQLDEKDRIIARQAAAIQIAEDNAAELAESRERVGRLKERASDAKEAASDAKKAFEAAQERHLELEEELLSGQQRLPFPVDPPTGGSSASPPPPSAEDSSPTTTTEADPEDDSWRSVELATLGTGGGTPLSKSILAKLEAGNIRTVGELADFTKPNPAGFCRQLTDLDGIGPGAAEKIGDAMASFWAGWSADQASSLEAATCQAVAETEAERGIAPPEPTELEIAESDEMHREAFDQANLADSADVNAAPEAEDDAHPETVGA